MKDGVCPKCGSTEVCSGEHLGYFAKMGSNWANTIPITAWRNAVFDNYVCLNCGYVESYVADDAKLWLIARKWPCADQRGSGPRRGQREARSERTCPECGRSLRPDWRACPYCGQPLV
jgi:predicted nucleic-acid-binding Zn-ribbon protein